MYYSSSLQLLGYVGVVGLSFYNTDGFSLTTQSTLVNKVSSSSSSSSSLPLSRLFTSLSLHSSNTRLYSKIDTPQQKHYDQNTIPSHDESQPPLTKQISSIAIATFISLSTATTMITPSSIVHAYEPTDYASETVTQAVQSVKKASGNAEVTLQEFENIAEIITEGKGVGGSINYSGVQLERGYVADEDTSIYNPGLSLLTESEKERLVEAIQTNRKQSLNKCTSSPTTCWSANNEEAYNTLKGKLDPYHMTELRGYLSVAPFYGAFLYLASLAVQQLQRDWFSVAYIVSAVAFFLPIFVLIGFS